MDHDFACGRRCKKRLPPNMKRSFWQEWFSMLVCLTWMLWTQFGGWRRQNFGEGCARRGCWMAWLIPGRVAAAFVFPPYEWGRPGLWTSGKGEGFGSFQYMILGMQLAMNGDADFPRIRKLVSSYQPLRESISELDRSTSHHGCQFLSMYRDQCYPQTIVFSNGRRANGSQPEGHCCADGVF